MVKIDKSKVKKRKGKKTTPKKEGQAKKSPATTTKRKARVSSKELAKTVDKTIEPHALNDDDTEKVRALIHLSREQGYLTFKDIDNSLPEIANQPEELQNVISIFNNLIRHNFFSCIITQQI